MKELIIIGGGPAGVAAGVYAARKELKTALITESFGGQSMESASIENWIGTQSISGIELAENLSQHLHSYEGDNLEIHSGDKVEKISKIDGGFLVSTLNGINLETKTVLIASGSSRKKLQIPGAEEFENRGITYCASCDGPMFRNKDVMVVGGGNAGFETAAQLLAYTKSVTLLHKNADFKAEPITVKKVLEHPNMTAIANALTKSIHGDVLVESLIYTDTTTGEDKEIATEGIFVEIGHLPATGFAEGLVERNPIGEIVTDPRTQSTSVPGIWAAGDCTDLLYHQNNIAAGDAVRALENIYLWLRAQ